MRFLRQFLLGFSVLCLGASTQLSASDAPGISVTVSFTPVAAFPTDIICSAEIRDIATGKLIALPRIVFTKGEKGRANIGDTEGSLVFEVSSNKAGTSGSYSVTYSKAGKVVAVHKGSISIQ